MKPSFERKHNEDLKVFTCPGKNRISISIKRIKVHFERSAALDKWMMIEKCSCSGRWAFIGCIQSQEK